MTIKNRGGVFGRNPTFNDVDVDGTLSVGGAAIPAPANTAKLDTAQTFTATQTMASGTGGILTLKTTDATGASGDILGKIDFFSGDTSGGSTGVQASVRGVYDTNGDSSALVFVTGYSTGSGSPTLVERMRVRSGGGLLIGTVDTDLNDTGDAGVYVEAGGRTKIAATGQEVMQINRSEADTNSRNIILFYRNGANVGKITGDGTSVAYVTSSDYRLKENVTAITDATDRLKQLNPVRFNFIADTTKTVDGFLAHELQAHVPEAVTGIKDGMQDEEYEITPAVFDDDGNEVTAAVMGIRSIPDYQGIDQAKIVPLLVATIKELEARITALEAG
jgi:hypothetical protein